MNAIIQELSQIGDVTLVRFVDETMWVTFRDGQSALSAVAKTQVEVRIRDCEQGERPRLIFLPADLWLAIEFRTKDTGLASCC